MNKRVIVIKFKKIAILDKVIESTVMFNHPLGHDSTRYDAIKQAITYYPNGIETTKNEKSIFLMDYFKKSIDQYTVLMNLGELLYKAQQLRLINLGQKPTGVNVVIEENKNVKAENPNNTSKGKKANIRKKRIRKAQKQSRKGNR